MKKLFRSTIARAGAIIALALAGLLGGGAAHAAGTAAGTTIGNLASLTFTVGGVTQNSIGSSPSGNSSGGGTTTTFVVDNKVNLTVVTADAANVSAVPGQAAATATFTLTNLGNNTQDFALTATSNYANATASPFSGTDNFSPSSCSAKTSGGATFVASLAPDQSATVLVVCAIPLGRVNGDIAVVSLTAQAKTAGSSGAGALTQSTSADTTGVDIVFADDVGYASGDVVRDAQHSAADAFQVQTASLTVTKTVAAVCDPLNGSSNPKSIPGAFVRYTISISNTGSASAILTSITDVLDSSVTFDNDLIAGATAGACKEVGSGGVATSANGSGFLLTYSARGLTSYLTTTNVDTDGAATASGTVSLTFADALPAGGAYAVGELKKAESLTVVYQVKIN